MLAVTVDTIRQTEPDSVVSAFVRHALSYPDRAACVAVQYRNGDLAPTTLSFGELCRKAALYQMALRECGLTSGDRVLISVRDPHVVLACLLGSMASGIIGVPVPSLSDTFSKEGVKDRIRSILGDCQPRLAVVESRQAWGSAFSYRGRPEVIEESALESHAFRSGAREVLELAATSGQDIAFLQYTSGSTGAPRGVAVTHANLLANVVAMGQRTRMTAKDCFVSWLPLHHDMGLVGALFLPLYWGARSVVLKTSDFLLRPALWLNALYRFQGTFSTAPPFAFALCADRVSERDIKHLELSRVRVLGVGAERISAEVLRRFCSRFERYGLNSNALFPVYGLAEATLAVTFPEPLSPVEVDHVSRRALVGQRVATPVPQEDPDAVEVVCVGRALRDHSVTILCHQTQQPLGERRLGEIVVEGPSVTPFYYAQRQSERRLRLHTGDIGYLAEGKLFVVDRLKDLVIVAGKNFSPSDIETVVSQAKGVRKGRVVAFSRWVDGATESLCILAELSPRSLRTQKAIAQEISTLVLRHFGLDIEQLTFLAPGSLPLTSSGKIRRRAARELLETGVFPPHLKRGARLKAIARYCAMAWVRRAHANR